jgi:hypothetical protein
VIQLQVGTFKLTSPTLGRCQYAQVGSPATFRLQKGPTTGHRGQCQWRGRLDCASSCCNLKPHGLPNGRRWVAGRHRDWKDPPGAWLFSRSRPNRDSPISRNPGRIGIGAKSRIFSRSRPNRDRENPGYFPGQIGTGRDGDSGISGLDLHPQADAQASSGGPALSSGMSPSECRSVGSSNLP